MWATIGKAAVPLLVGVVSTAFYLGTKLAHVASNQHDLMLWKAEVNPQIQRMDSKGTAAGERFSLEQGKELGRMEKDLEELKKEAKSIEAMKLKIDTLERATFQRVPNKP